MAYVNPYTPTEPDGATDLAKNAPADMKAKEAMMVERLTQIFGFNFTLDPILLTKLGDAANQAATISSKLLYKSEHDAGNSGVAKTLNFTTDGPVQKLTLTASCTLTIPTPAAGASGVLRVVQNATGGWTLTFPANWNVQSNIALVVITTASTATLYSWYSDGTVVYLMLAGTGFDVS